MRRILFFILVGILIIALSSPPAPGNDEGQARTEGQLQHEVSVTRKLIHVIVTDRDGKPVTDLRKDEFVLFDNGKQMTLSEFESHKLSLPGEEQKPVAPAPAEKAPAAAPVAVPAPAPERSSPAAPLMSRTFFFLFDLVFADAGGMKQAREAALRYLETKLEAHDQIAVLSFTGGRSLNVHHSPNHDQIAARQAVDSIGLDLLMPIAPIRPADESSSRMKVGGGSDSIDSSGIEPFKRTSGVGRIVAANFIWALDCRCRLVREAAIAGTRALRDAGTALGFQSAG